MKSCLVFKKSVYLVSFKFMKSCKNNTINLYSNLSVVNILPRLLYPFSEAFHLSIKSYKSRPFTPKYFTLNSPRITILLRK